jgi:hypothetical protein
LEKDSSALERRADFKKQGVHVVKNRTEVSCTGTRDEKGLLRGKKLQARPFRNLHLSGLSGGWCESRIGEGMATAV